MTAAISFLDREDEVGFAIAAALEVHVPGMEKAEVEDLLHKAHDICPYSWAIRDKVDVKLSVA
jgi:organic hydroperoxide reductase OsmC/OhrA